MATDPLAPPSSTEMPKSSPKSLIDKAKSRLKEFYEKYEKYSELAIFGVGFIWDSITMTRVDSVIDNIILLFYQILIGGLIYGAVILHVAAHWIAVGAIVLFGLAILKGVQATRGKDPSS